MQPAREEPQPQPLRLAVSGATGRVGRRVATLARASDAFVLVEVLAGPGSDAQGLDLGSWLGGAPWDLPVRVEPEADYDVLVDLSVASASAHRAEECAARGAGIVVGTTGQDAAQRSRLEAAARRIPLLLAPNLSPGVAVLTRLVAEARAALGPEYDVELVETHRRGKLDAPSGTALALAAALEPDRAPDEPPALPIHSLRLGDVRGEHELRFAGPGETLLLRHTALDRDLFARGALRAARWLAGRDPGLYTMTDVLFPSSDPTQDA